MELQQLRYVRAIAETGSFSRAAERCQVTQPSLSQQVLKLEEELGAKLFDRLGRSIRLTEAGRALIPYARAILDQVEAARLNVANKSADLSGTVTIGVIPTVAPYLMPRCTAAFTKMYPHAKLRIVEETTPILVDGLRDLSLDFAILALPLRHKDLALLTLHTEPLFAVLPKDHARAAATSLAIKDLRKESFVLLRDGHCFRELSMSACKRARFAPQIAFESGQFSSLLGMVAAGVGISMVPEMAIAPSDECKYVRLRDSRASRTIVAANLRGRNLNRIQQAFLAAIQSAAERMRVR